MKPNFRSVLLGYSPAMVQKTISAIETDYKHKIQELEIKAAQDKKEVEQLKQEIEKIKEEIGEYKSLETKTKDFLLSTHLQKTEQVMQTMLKAAELEENAFRRVYEQGQELDQLNKMTEKLTKELLAATKRSHIEKDQGAISSWESYVLNLISKLYCSALEGS